MSQDDEGPALKLATTNQLIDELCLRSEVLVVYLEGADHIYRTKGTVTAVLGSISVLQQLAGDLAIAHLDAFNSSEGEG